MELKGSIKSYERYMFEDIYPAKYSVNEASQTTTFFKTGIYTKKLCEIIPELKDKLGKMYDELDILDFVYAKRHEEKFNKFLEKLNPSNEIDVKEIIANTGEFPIVPEGSDIYMVFNTSKINNELLKPTSNETLEKSFDGLGSNKIRNIIQITGKIFIKVFDSDQMENVQPRKILLLDSSDVIDKFNGEVTNRPQRARNVRSHVTPEFMKLCVDEKNVTNNYHHTLVNYGFRQTGAILRTDNIYTFNIGEKEYHLLTEYKFGINMKNAIQFAGLLAQCIAYIKRIEMSGTPIPEVILCGDDNECFVFTYESIAKYLNVPGINWSAQASNFLKSNEALLMKIIESDVVQFIYDINEEFNFKDVFSKIKELAKGSITKTKINPRNISTAFHYFSTRVLSKDVTLNANEKVNLFIQILVNPDDNYLHPSKSEIISSHFGVVKIDRKQFKSFISNYEGFHYSNEEKIELAGVSDMIILEEDRRKQGEYFTPDVLTMKADEYLSWHLGSDYKDEYFVWDCAAGMGNLTRNFKYKHLYQSTLHNSDTQTMKQSNINPEATKFQFDFLNDDLDKLPKELMEAIKENKKILFYINPPYGTATNLDNISSDELSAKVGIVDNKVNSQMKVDDFGKASANMYTQFLYRIWKIKKDFNLNNINIGLFSPELYLSGSGFNRFREKFLKDFKYENGFLTPASLFSDVAKSWGILFSIWTNGKSEKSNNFPVEIYDTDENSLNVENKGTKLLYNMDNDETARDWVKSSRKINKDDETILVPHMTSAINSKEVNRVKVKKDFIGSLMLLNNSVARNHDGVFFSSSMAFNGNSTGIEIGKENFYNATTTFTARKLIISNWVNQKDEYMIPDENNSKWEQFKYDSIVYSLFNTSSQQSSLRNVNYQGKNDWNVFNEFFWVPIEKMKELISKSSNGDLYKDIQTYGKQRYVAQLLYDDGVYGKLSEDAKYVLDEATKYVVKSIGIRDMVDKERPELNANTWDAGWYQLKGIATTMISHKNDTKLVSDAYKEFGDRLRPLVYELGFLK